MGHRFHVTREQQQRDAQRRNELQELGELVLEFTTADVAYRPMQTIGRLRRLLAQRRARAA
jgi:very-short-patch-repair endonuclease